MKNFLRGFKLRNVPGIVLGCFIAALALNLLLVPNRIAPGGVGGLAVVLFHLFDIPVSLVMIMVNIPLFILGLYILGARFGINTLLGTLLLPIFVTLTEQLTPYTGDLLLAAIYGGILMGIGVGIVFRSEGTTGGTALAAQILHKYTGLTIGQGLLGIDFLVVAFAGLVFDAELAMYSLIALIVCSRVIDLVQQGLRNAKAAFIISKDPEAVSRGVLDQLQRGATLLQARGAWSRQDREMLMVVVNSSEITKLKSLVSGLDPDAFVIVTDIQEVQGEGFSR